MGSGVRTMPRHQICVPPAPAWDYAALSGAKVLQALLQADDGFCDKLLELAKVCPHDCALYGAGGGGGVVGDKMWNTTHGFPRCL